MARTSPLLKFEIDKRDIADIEKRFARASGKSLAVHLERSNKALGVRLARRVRAAAPKGPTGNLRKSVKARSGKTGSRLFGTRHSTSTVYVGPTAPHRHLVILGTGLRSAVGPKPSSMYRRIGNRVVRREAIPNVGRMTPNPFVSRAAAGFEDKMRRHIQSTWKDLLR